MEPKSRFRQCNHISIPHYPRAIDRPNQNDPRYVQTNGGRHERAFHILRQLGSTPESSADMWLDRGSTALAKIGRLAVRSISARTPLHARARTPMAQKAWRAAHASIRRALLARPDQSRPSHDRSYVARTLERFPFSLTTKLQAPYTESALDSMFVAFPYGML
jgi:hypothetical protein